MDFAALYIFWGLGIWFFFFLGRKMRCILLCTSFVQWIQGGDGKQGMMILFFPWLVYEVYKGKDGLFFPHGIRDNGASITGHIEVLWHDLDKELNN